MGGGKEKQEIPAEIAGMSFEKSLEELELAVSGMEREKLPLEKLIQVFERGSLLAAHCRNKLDELEKRIEILSGKESPEGDWQEFRQ